MFDRNESRSKETHLGGNSRVKNTDPSAEQGDLTIVLYARGASCLRAAIESALAVKPAAILIATDGGGLDEPRIAQQYERDHPGRIRILHRRRRRGAAFSINQAVEQVRTPFFARLDGDAVLLPEHLEEALRMIAAHPSVAAIAGYAARLENKQRPTYRADPNPQILSGADASRFLLSPDAGPCPAGCIYRTDAYRAAGGFAAIPCGEDRELWLRLAERWELAYCHAPSAVCPPAPRECVGYEAACRAAARVYGETDAAPLVRRAFARAAGLYAAQALREAVTFRKRAFASARGIVRCLYRAVFLPGVGAPRQSAARAAALGAGSRGGSPREEVSRV